MTAFPRGAEAGGAKPPALALPDGASDMVPVWNPLVRLFHWSLVAAFAIAWATGDELEKLHEATGYAILGLLAVRLVWGFVGTPHARFADFVHRPATVARHLLDIALLRAKRYIGHNPAGGAMVLALMAMLAATCATGIATETGLWGARWMEDVHEAVANLTVLLVGLHVAGVFVASAEHRENLVKAMVTGRKRRR